MNKRLGMAGALLILVVLTIGLCAVTAASAAPHTRALRYKIVRHARAYDVARGHHCVLRIGHHERYVAVGGVPRYRVVRRAHRYVFLSTASAAVVRGSTNGVIPSAAPVSAGLPSLASSELAENAAVAGNDGQTATRWVASTRAYPQWWMVDLGAATTVSGVEANWYGAEKRAYRYLIEASLDGTTFTTVKDRSRNQTKGTTTDAVSAVARYVRVRILGRERRQRSGRGQGDHGVRRGDSDSDAAADPRTQRDPDRDPDRATPTPSPSASYAVVPSGGNDTAAIQSAVNACGTRGGTVTFAPGVYTVTSSIKLPPGNTAPLTLSGYGAKIVLDGATGSSSSMTPPTTRASGTSTSMASRSTRRDG